ncbi:MAG: mandelate racemase/muconate lactonizing enzyme family protein [Dehalococcoidia bacterium]
MKISALDAAPIREPLDVPFGNGQGWTTSREYLIVRATAEDGTVGYGECWGPIAGNDQIVREVIAPLLIGQPVHTGRLWHEVAFKLRWAYHSFSPVSALSGVDIALWDLRGRLLGLPIHEMLGGACHTSVPAYATGHYFRPVDTVEQQIEHVIEEASINLERGFRRLKIKIGLGMLGMTHRDDIALMRAVRERFEGVGLMADANCRYDLGEAVSVGRAAEEFGYDWFEEPLPPTDLDGYEQLSRKIDIPIAGGESWPSLTSFFEVFSRRLVAVAQPDVGSAGGITEVKRIADLAHAMNVACYPHVWGTPIAMAASLHVLATLPGRVLLEFDQSPNPIREALVRDPFILSDGAVAVPQGPGLGITVDDEALARFAPAWPS